MLPDGTIQTLRRLIQRLSVVCPHTAKIFDSILCSRLETQVYKKIGDHEPCAAFSCFAVNGNHIIRVFGKPCLRVKTKACDLSQEI